MPSITFRTYQICNRCVMDTTDPDIVFDDMGVCSHCVEASSRLKRAHFERMDLPWVYTKIRENKGKYKCLLGLSGGVDSSMCLHYLVQNDIIPFCFTVDNGWNSPESDENIMRMVESLKVPFYRYTIDLATFRELQLAFIKSGTPNLEIPTDHILMATTYEMAEKYQIKTIISGGNLATESIMPPSWGYNARDLKFIKSVYKAFTKKELTGMPTISLLKYLKQRFISGVQTINLLDYYEYNREQAIQLLSETYGYKPYGEKHEESNFTKWFQSLYLPGKFGIDKRKAHYSSLINSHQMTREQALKLLAVIPSAFEILVKNSVGDNIPISASEIITSPRRTHRDYPNHEKLYNFLTNIYSKIK